MQYNHDRLIIVERPEKYSLQLATERRQRRAFLTDDGSFNIMAQGQGLSTPDPSLSPTHLSIRRGRTTTTHYTHHQVSLMVSRNTTLVFSLGLRIGLACEAGLNAGMRSVPPRIRKKERTTCHCKKR